MREIKRNYGSAITVVLAMLATLALIVFAFSNGQASSDDINRTVALAGNNADAVVKVKMFLATNPAPTRGDLYGLESEINEILVRDKARQVTGNHSLKTASEIKADAVRVAKQSDHQMGWLDVLLKYLNVLTLFVFALMAVVKVSQFLSNVIKERRRK